MNLYTCCPSCQTTFRVGTPQLQASGGQVRCGFCSRVFDAFASLTAHEPQAPATDAPSPDAAPAATPGPVGSPAEPSPASPRLDPAAPLYEWEFRMPDVPRRTGLWIGLGVLALIALALQAIYVFRAEISVSLPQTRPAFLKLCAKLGCGMTPPSFSAWLNIEASDLKALDPGSANEIELGVLVRNRAPIELPHPAFELTLTDPLDQPIARRVFLPRDYLQGAVAATMRPGGELPIHLFMSTGDVHASGYRLYLFYP